MTCCASRFTNGRIQASICAILAATLRWSSVAPLATPVVPPVYCRKATSSGATATVLSGVLRPSARTHLNVSAFGRWKGCTAFFRRRDTRFTTEHEEDARTGVVHLMAQLARSIERVDVDDRAAGDERPEKDRRIGEHVRQ